MYFYGQLSDDYGLAGLNMVYYPVDSLENKQKVVINIDKGNIAEFFKTFPDKEPIVPGVSYEIYFELRDNDEVNGSKTVRSETFIFRKRTKEELQRKQLEQQRNTIDGMDKTLKGFERQENALEALTKNQKEKRNLSFSDKKKLEQFLERQKQQDALMERFNERLKKSINSQENDNVTFKKDLEKRLEDNEAQLERDEKLLEALEEVKDKIAKENLTEKLDELAKRSKNKKRSLEQLLELTKRFYVQKKLDQLTSDLERMAEDQEALSEEKTYNNKSKQEALNNRFEAFKKALDTLEKDSESLRKPIPIPRDILDENAIQKDQKDALENLSDLENSSKESPEDDLNKEQKRSKARQQQKQAANKMRDLKKKMEKSSISMGQDQLQEDAEMLRQILDNLVVFSFDQEMLMNTFKKSSQNDNKFSVLLRKQNNLKVYFEHIDDSLYALSLRQPKLSESVNENITDVYYNMDKALDLFSEADVFQGVSKQQFVVTAANNLADFLSDVLDNMEENLSLSSGQSGEGEMQLPDIIMSQKELNEMMQKGMRNSDQKEGEEGESGKTSGNETSGSHGKKDADSGAANSGEERMNGMLFEIFQRQHELRRSLENKLREKGFGNEDTKMLDRMEEVETDLLNKGFNKETLQKMLNLKHELLKLDSASFLQGEDDAREANTNQEQFDNTVENKIPKAKRYFNSLEILNKQALPLQGIYKKKVQEYFKVQNDSI